MGRGMNYEDYIEGLKEQIRINEEEIEEELNLISEYESLIESSYDSINKCRQLIIDFESEINELESECHCEDELFYPS